MSTRSHTRVAARPPSGGRVQRGRPSARRRKPRAQRRFGAVLAMVVTAVFVVWAIPQINHAVQDLSSLPLADQGIIRHQAGEKHLDPALIAAVIYAETKFVPRTSSTGAEGLMQIEPATAQFLAHLTGGYAFTTADLATPSINIAYGSYYLRYLLDHYDGHEMLAVAAYNGGLANVDRWVADARAHGHSLAIDEIPFAETRAYVTRVLQAQQEYRSKYAAALGLSTGSAS